MRIWWAVVVASVVSGCRPGPSAPETGAVHLEFVARPATVIAGQPMPTISVSVFDEHDHVVPDSTEVTLVAPVTFTGPHGATTIGGIATFEGLVFTRSEVGRRLVATAEGATRTSGPFDVLAAEASDVTIALTAATPQVQVGAVAPLEVTVHDHFGNPVPNASLTLSANDPNDLLAPAAGATTQAGTFSSTFTTSEPGPKTVTVVTPSLTARTSFDAIAGPASASLSIVTASPSSLVADGHDTATVHVVLRDEFSNPLVHQVVALEATGSAVIFPTKRATDRNGTASFTVRSTTVGVMTLHASTEAGPLLAAPTLTFTEPSYRLVVYVDGLTTGELVLSGSGQFDLTIPAGTERAEFTAPLTPGQPYSVAVRSQPAGAACRVFGGANLAGASNSFVRVSCARAWRQVADFLQGAAGVLADGTPWVWGSAYVPTSIPYRLDSAAWTSIVVQGGYSNSLVGLRADGTLWRWPNGWYPPTRIGTGSDWVSVTGTGMLALTRSDGSLWTLGSGFGPTLPAFEVAGGVDAFRQVSEGISATDDVRLGIKPDGSLWEWALGNSFTVIAPPAQIGTATNWKQVSAGSRHALATRTDGTLWRWNLGDSPTQLGVSTDWASANAWRGEQLPLGDYSIDHMVKTDGSLWKYDAATGELLQIGTDTDWSFVDYFSALKTDGSLWTTGYEFQGAFGQPQPLGRPFPSPHVLPGPYAFISAAAGAQRTTQAVTTDGTLIACGTWAGFPTPLFGPTIISSPVKWVQTFRAGDAMFGLATDGTLWEWSPDLARQPIEVAPGETWLSVIALGPVAAGVRSDGTLWWVTNNAPIDTRRGWRSVATNAAGFLGLRDDGTIWQQLDSAPTRLADRTDWDFIADGYGIRADGTLWVLGPPSVQIGTDSDWVSVASTSSAFAPVGTTLALKRDGTLWSWGDNVANVLSPPFYFYEIPTPMNLIGGHDWVSVSSSGEHAVGLRSDGSLWLWGRDTESQLCDGLRAFDFHLAP
jgi:hypothetical protein